MLRLQARTCEGPSCTIFLYKCLPTVSLTRIDLLICACKCTLYLPLQTNPLCYQTVQDGGRWEQTVNLCSPVICLPADHLSLLHLSLQQQKAFITSESVLSCLRRCVTQVNLVLMESFHSACNKRVTPSYLCIIHSSFGAIHTDSALFRLPHDS